MEKNIVSFPGLGIGEMELSPIALELGPIKVAWYGIIITCGFLLAFLYAFRRAKKEHFSTDDLTDYLLYGMVFGVIGARMYYVLTKLDSFVVKGDLLGTLYKMVAVWEGGLAIYGGIIGGVLTVLVVSKLKRQSFLQVTDMVVPGVAVAQAIGRWGNFVNAEAYGGLCTMPWRMGILKKGMTDMVYVHPTFLYESLWNLAGFLILHFLVTPKRRYHGQTFLCYVAWYGLGRMFIEGMRTDSLYVPGTEIRISQLLAFLSCLFALSLLVYFGVTGRKSAALVGARGTASAIDVDGGNITAAEGANEEKEEDPKQQAIGETDAEAASGEASEKDLIEKENENESN